MTTSDAGSRGQQSPPIDLSLHPRIDRGVLQLGKPVAGPHLDKLASMWPTIRTWFNYIVKSTGILSGNVILSNDQSTRHHYPTHLLFVELR